MDRNISYLVLEQCTDRFEELLVTGPVGSQRGTEGASMTSSTFRKPISRQPKNHSSCLAGGRSHWDPSQAQRHVTTAVLVPFLNTTLLSGHRLYQAMTAQAQNFRELLEYIEDVVYGVADVTANSVSYRLQLALPSFLALLQYKVLQDRFRTPAHLPSTVYKYWSEPDVFALYRHPARSLAKEFNRAALIWVMGRLGWTRTT